ncbi:MAG: NADH-quinone oxidoreductase subunit NuoN [Burkholderiaceae bacterium]|nr:NADH-quinone oxidoreductase subunit NuoN [Burkholderiaceae bacterium]
MENLKLMVALPEIALLVAASMVIIADAAAPERCRMAIDRLALGALLFPLTATIWQMGAGQGSVYGFNGMYVADSLGHLLKLCSYAAVAATIVYARGYGMSRGLQRGEFYGLILFALLGQMVMISSASLLVVYMGLELMSLSLYAIAAMRRDSPASTEAAMKYFILGALASGFLLYGMSMLYGGAGDLSIAGIAKAFSDAQTNKIVLVFGTVFIVAGLAFKFGAVPFHMWVPDVYQGTPTSATLLIAGAPKLAAFAIAFRLLVEGLLAVAADWQQMLIVLAVLSLGVGNIVAIAQTNLKRMLAYSTISQVGFVLLGLLSGVVQGNAGSAAGAYSGSLFYVISYVLTTLGTFGLIQVLARQGFEAEEIADLRGLNRRSPGLALVMLILMFSLAGVPPFVGFYAKLAVLQSVVNAGLVWLAVYAVLMSLIGAFYYLRVVKTMYFDDASDSAPILAGADAKAVLAVNGALVLLLGLVPGPLMTACANAIRQALSG